jgi:hypothetical protein
MIIPRDGVSPIRRLIRQLALNPALTYARSPLQ